MKPFNYKLLAFVCVITLLASCASVTDANLNQQSNAKVLVPPQPNVVFSNGNDVEPVMERPDPCTYYDEEGYVMNCDPGHPPPGQE